MGEIGRERQEFLYKMTYAEIALIVRGYMRRNILHYQLQRMQIHASTFCMGNPDHIKPTDIVHLYFDDYKGQDAPIISKEEQDSLQAELNALTAQYHQQ